MRVCACEGSIRWLTLASAEDSADVLRHVSGFMIVCQKGVRSSSGEKKEANFAVDASEEGNSPSWKLSDEWNKTQLKLFQCKFQKFE